MLVALRRRDGRPARRCLARRPRHRDVESRPAATAVAPVVRTRRRATHDRPRPGGQARVRIRPGGRREGDAAGEPPGVGAHDRGRTRGAADARFAPVIHDGSACEDPGAPHVTPHPESGCRHRHAGAPAGTDPAGLVTPRSEQIAGAESSDPVSGARATRPDPAGSRTRDDAGDDPDRAGCAGCYARHAGPLATAAAAGDEGRSAEAEGVENLIPGSSGANRRAHSAMDSADASARAVVDLARRPGPVDTDNGSKCDSAGRRRRAATIGRPDSGLRRRAHDVARRAAR